jgi:beta-lactamase regulating signal transducer with metallopeptidase domain
MIDYLLKSASCLALLLLFYHLILEKEKMHIFNRFYLLGSVIFSLLVPFATLTVASTTEFTEAVQTILHTTASIDSIAPISIKESFDYSLLFMGIYGFVSLILLLRFGKNVFKIIRKIKANKKIQHQTATLVLVEDNILPHSFWNAIFINKSEFEQGTIETELFTHELTHVTQKHTLDIVLIEMLHILFWINPLFIFLKKAIQLNHEFLADETVINQHQNTFQYQHLLLNKAAWNNEYYLASNLNYSLTKKRLKMMTTQSSRTKVLLKKLAVIPLFTGFVFLFAERVEAQENIEVIKEVPSKNDLLETDLYKEYVYRDGFIRVEDENGKKINKKYNELTTEEKKKVPPPPPLTSKKKIPSKQLINDLKDPKKFAVWIDRKVVNNTILDKYKNTDFSNYSVSFVNKNARSKLFPQEYQVHISTNKYFKGEHKKRVTNFSKYLKKEYKIEEIKETPKKNDDLDFSIPTNNASKQSIPSTKLATKTKNLRLESQNESQIFNSTGFILINGKKHFYVNKHNVYKYYNRQGKLVNSKGKIIANKQTNASDVIKGQYITKVYDDDILVAEFKDNTPSNYISDSEYDLKEVLESNSPPPISPLNFVEKQKDKNVDYFYNNKKIDYDKALQLIKNNRPINIETRKVNEKMIIILSKEIEEIREQRKNKSTPSLEKYKVLNDLYEGKRIQVPHFIKSDQERQTALMDQFLQVRSMYVNLSKEQKRKTKKPVHPHDPYVRLMKNNIVFYKLRTELTEEDKLLFPPPPARWDASKQEKLRAKKARKDWQKRTGNDIPVPPPPKKTL